MRDKPVKDMPDYQKTSLHDLQVEVKVGIRDWERTGGKTQKLIVDIDLYRFHRHFKGTRIEDCIDYSVPYDFIMREWPKRPHTELIETLAEELAEVCFRDKKADAVRVAIRKPHAFNGNAVPGVEFFRHRKAKKPRGKHK